MSPTTTGGNPIMRIEQDTHHGLSWKPPHCYSCANRQAKHRGETHCQQAHRERQTDNGYQITVKTNQQAKGCEEGRTEIIHRVTAPDLQRRTLTDIHWQDDLAKLDYGFCMFIMQYSNFSINFAYLCNFTYTRVRE